MPMNSSWTSSARPPTRQVPAPRGIPAWFWDCLPEHAGPPGSWPPPGAAKPLQVSERRLRPYLRSRELCNERSGGDQAGRRLRPVESRRWDGRAGGVSMGHPSLHLVLPRTVLSSCLTSTASPGFGSLPTPSSTPALGRQVHFLHQPVRHGCWEQRPAPGPGSCSRPLR